ncbi:hypothetical protein PHLCEN_2v5875 [Hermanssonia centrifuga]|uniref:Uncharacterized protein n=1 Tax=Hermanssonia centrifuga TaxID=98765 RepID=A0A2R6P133_9APHY|nr:hypothetical protein PHLCEN_2v5875 [Hermanssonia centrifuga]
MPVHLAPFTRQDTQDTEHSESGGLSSTEDLYHGQLPSNSKFNKHSREPLLPIAISGARRSTASRPSIAVTGPYGKSETNVSTTGRMRGSFEKLFKRGLSFETGRKPVNPSDVLDSASMDPAVNCIPRSRQTSPITPTANGRMTFDLAATDEEHSPVSPITRYKNSSTPPAASLTSLQDLVFNPIPPYDMNPPLAETPIVDTKTGKQLRNWQLHPSRNRFFGGGHFLTGGDSPWAFIASLTLVLGITGVWFGTTCLWWWFNESPAVAAVVAYMCLLTISSMLATAFRDPGILPRNLDPDPPSASTGSEDSHRVPLPRDLKVRAGGVITALTAATTIVSG